MTLKSLAQISYPCLATALIWAVMLTQGCTSGGTAVASQSPSRTSDVRLSSDPAGESSSARSVAVRKRHSEEGGKKSSASKHPASGMQRPEGLSAPGSLTASEISDLPDSLALDPDGSSKEVARLRQQGLEIPAVQHNRQPLRQVVDHYSGYAGASKPVETKAGTTLTIPVREGLLFLQLTKGQGGGTVIIRRLVGGPAN